MQIKSIILILCLTASQNLMANTPSPLPAGTPLEFTSEVGCILPPPDVLNVVDVGSDVVKLSWNAVTNASQYRVRILDEQSGNTLSTKFVPGNNTSGEFSITGNHGHPCRAEIISVCSDGSWDAVAFRKSEIIIPIIIELVSVGFTPHDHPSANCTVSPNPGCSFTWLPINTETAFMVRYGTQSRRQFSVKVTNSGQGGATPRVKFTTESAGTALNFITNADGSAVDIFYMPTGALLVSLTTLHPITPGMQMPGYLRISPEYNQNTTVERLITDIYQDQSLKRFSDDRQASAHLPLNISPNPFTDLLSIQLPEPTNQRPTTVHLYDLLGAEKIRHTASADQLELNLNTVDLAPGVYFLRIDAGDHQATVKVVKAQ